MNCSRLCGPLVSGPRQFSKVLTCVGKYRTINQTLLHNPGSVRSYYNSCQLSESFRSRLKKSFQRHGTAIFCACSQQAQYIVGQRIWRGQQVGLLYFKLWGGVALSGVISRMLMRIFISISNTAKSRCSRILLSCSAITLYDWRTNNISDSEMTKYMGDVEAALCLKRRTFDINQSTVTSRCTCDKGKADHSKFERDTDPWSIFLELRHLGLLVWKRENPEHRGDGLYEYKVYGMYKDVTAMDFMETNMNTTYRKMWDAAAVVLEILEKGPNDNDVVYWEMQWPRMMSNRDYVYQRRHLVDRARKVIVIINKNTDHPSAPPKAGKERVSEYWSIIVIRPVTELNKPGIEFTMTYFDNPGANVPSSIAQWASATAFPDFHKRLHEATRLYQSKLWNIREVEKAAALSKTSTNAPWVDPVTKKIEEECEAETKKQKVKKPSKDEKKPEEAKRRCIIRRSEQDLMGRLPRLGP